MIAKAKVDFPNQQWLLFEAGKDQLAENFDIVFSNATIQWIPGHDDLIEQFHKLLNNSGILAVQLPRFFDMPISKAISEVAGMAKWKDTTYGIIDLWAINSPSFYYDHLAKYFSKVDLWTTDYFHVMESHTAILEMIRTTGLKPYLERITDKDRNEFEMLVLDRIKKDYPSQYDGKVLFPFKRLFFVAKK
jgi:trans-aconitate 2-methyltransferase